MSRTSRFLLYFLTLVFLTKSFIAVDSQDVSSDKTIHFTTKEIVGWKFKTNGAVYASPIINEDVVYIGSLDSTFYAINAENGLEIWNYKTNGIISGNALLADNKIVFESGNNLLALDKNGKLKWKFQLCENNKTGKIDPWDFHRSSPVLHNNIVFIGSENGIMYGVNINSGKEEVKIQTPTKYLIRSTPVIHNEVIYFGDWEGVMYAYNLQQKEFVWEFDTKKEKSFEYWKNSILGTPQYYKESVYFAGRSAALYCLNAETGKLKWINRSPSDQWLLGSPIIIDNILYLGSSDQHLYQAFNCETGEVIWSTELDCRIWGTAFIEKNSIYIGSRNFYKLNKHSGLVESIVEFKTVHEDVSYGEYVERTANFHSSPAPYKNCIIIGSDSGYLYSISKF